MLMTILLLSGLTAPPQNARRAAGAACRTVLPSDVQQQLARMEGWTIQQPSSLGARARERWTAEKPLACPGVAVGRFSNDSGLSYAVLLVSASQSGAYKLLMFTAATETRGYAVQTLDSGDMGAVNFFVHQVAIHKFFNAAAVGRLRPEARDGLLVVDAGNDEYQSDIYFFTRGAYRREWIDY